MSRCWSWIKVVFYACGASWSLHPHTTKQGMKKLSEALDGLQCEGRSK